MAPRKKKPAPARKAAKPPVLNLKATEVKSAGEKSAAKAESATASAKTAKPAEKSSASAGENSTGTKTSTPKTSRSKTSTPKTGTPKTGGADTNKTSGTTKPASPVKEKKKSGKGGLILVGLAALIAAGLGGAWAFKTYGAKYFADPNAVKAEQLAEVVTRVAKLESVASENKSTKELAARLKKQFDQNSAALTANKALIEANGKKLAALENTAKEVRVALAKAVENGKGPIAVANELQFKAITEKLGEFEKSLAAVKGVPADSAEKLASLKTRLDALLVRLSATEEQTGAVAKSIALVKAAQEKLASAPASNPASETARAFTVLRAQIMQGGAFANELDEISGLMPEETTLDVLRPFANEGAPTLASLSSALNKINFAAAPAGDDKSEKTDGGMFGALSNRLSGLVKVTKAGQSDWSALKQKALQALKAGQVASAVEILRNGDNAPDDVAAWLSLADKKIKIDQAVKDLSAKIVARLTAGQK